MQNARTIIENLLTKGKLEAAIEGCLILCRHYGDQERYSIVAQHSARFHTLMDDFNAGTLSDDDYRPERARINRAMLDLVNDIPVNWAHETLLKAGFSEAAFDTFVPSNQNEPFRKWGLIILMVAGLIGILGYILKDLIFSEKELPSLTQPVQNMPNASEVNSGQDSEKKEPSVVASKPTEKIPGSSKPPVFTNTLATPDNKFRSFGKLKVVDDMELGYIGTKLAFRNVRNKEILCCYTDAKDFSGGKAYVSEDGQHFFYINKKGDKVE